jgi:hypothetical protein
MATTNKIVYLLGAGATHAEIFNAVNLREDAVSNPAEYGLLISDVSKRILNKAKAKEEFNFIKYGHGASNHLDNVEYLISLLLTSHVKDSEKKVNILRELVKDDIKSVLDNWSAGFYLHDSLLELSVKNEELSKEELLGIISLNYDDVIDNACKHNAIEYDYGFGLEKKDKKYLLKLHGSFNWTEIEFYGKSKDIPIIPLGMNKNYLVPPYNFIWSNAFDVLAKCDMLRVIGCSLSQSEYSLIDLLFKVRIERERGFTVEIIDVDTTSGRIEDNYGFFLDVIGLGNARMKLNIKASEYTVPGAGNPFKAWLKAKAIDTYGNENKAKETKFVKRIFEGREG